MAFYPAARAIARPKFDLYLAQALAHAKCLLLFALLQALDIATTGYGLANGLTREYNPLAASVLENGLLVMLGAKAMVVTLVALAVIRLSVRFRRIWASLWIGNCFYLVVLALNLWSLLP